MKRSEVIKNIIETMKVVRRFGTKDAYKNMVLDEQYANEILDTLLYKGMLPRPLFEGNEVSKEDINALEEHIDYYFNWEPEDE